MRNGPVVVPTNPSINSNAMARKYAREEYSQLKGQEIMIFKCAIYVNGGHPKDVVLDPPVRGRIIFADLFDLEKCDNKGWLTPIYEVEFLDDITTDARLPLTMGNEYCRVNGRNYSPCGKSQSQDAQWMLMASYEAKILSDTIKLRASIQPSSPGL